MIKVICLSAVLTFFSVLANAQSTKETAVANAVEKLRKAMVDADSATLSELAVNQLSYGHSSGHVDTKAEFISKIASGKSDFVSIELADQSILVSDKTALVRHKLNAVTNDGGKPGEVHLHVLLVWQKLRGDWKLLARQAVKQQ